MSGLLLEFLQEAVTRVEVAAFPHRRPGYNLAIISQWTTREETDANVAWARDTFRVLEAHMAARSYVNDLSLRADLVTLSARDTGNGRLLGQEGIASLERAFLLAGAKSVLASLWTDDDIFTTALMKRFYQRLVVDHQDKGTALRQAKLDLLEKFGSAGLPTYWAGFVLVGDGAT